MCLDLVGLDGIGSFIEPYSVDLHILCNDFSSFCEVCFVDKLLRYSNMRLCIRLSKLLMTAVV